jgi:ribosome-associated translation inhibitor RaiA
MTEFKATVEFIGLKDLNIDSFTKSHINSVAEKYADKFSEHVQNNVKLKVHIRQYKASQAGKEHKYSIKTHLIFPGDTISVDKSSEWDIKLAIQKAMKDMENRLQDIFRD